MSVVSVPMKLETIVSFHSKNVLKENINTFLSRYFSHPRDNNIHFDKKTYKFVINGIPDKKKCYTSATRFVHKHFKEFNADEVIQKMMSSPKWPQSPYYGMSVEEIKKLWDDKGKLARVDGTNMHSYIETYYNYLMFKKIKKEEIERWMNSSQSLPEEYSIHTFENILSSNYELPKEYLYFHNYERDRLEKHPESKHWVPYRTEWLVYDDDLKILGYIDMVFKNIEDGTYIVCDWKRCKEIKKTNPFQTSTTECISHIPDANYWHYAIQLNVYKVILERKYGMKVSALYLMSFHPECSKYDRLKVPFLNDEMEELLNIDYKKET